MGIKDYLLKEIDNLRDRRNQAFNMFFAFGKVHDLNQDIDDLLEKLKDTND